jgi:hypothetical protein
MRHWIVAIVLLGACRPSGAGSSSTRLPDSSVTGHPRLWVRAADLPRLRAWATGKNAMWDALRGAAEEARGEMDARKVPAGKDCMNESGTQGCEEYAELFAFMSLVSPSEKERHDYAARAIKLVMTVVQRAAKGPSDSDELRRDKFSIDDRSRWNGEAFALTVDWVYPYLTAAEKKTIRNVFLHWADVITHADTTDNNHPEPIGVVEDPKLVEDHLKTRWAGNNYYTAHARNLAMMALSFDAADDPGGELRSYVKRATGAWLYVIDAYLRGDGRGGLPADGIEYGPQSLAYLAQALWALHTAGADDAKSFGKQSRLDGNPYWRELLVGWPMLMSARTVEHPWLGQVYQPAWWGEGQHYFAPESVDLFAPIAILARDTGDTATAEAARWIALHLGPGEAAGLDNRARNPEVLRRAILYFLMMDPKAPAPSDPRSATSFVAPGLGKILARTDWTKNASIFDFGIGWITVDHQHADGNAFQWYRKGEWLVKERTGYGEHIVATDAHDAVCIENAQPAHVKDKPEDYRALYWKRGSQYTNGVTDDDGKLLAHSENAHYVYALGDATALYNSDHEEIHDVAQASRAIVWLGGDWIVVYDRAATKVDGRFKRMFLQLTAKATVAGRRATVKTPGGQYLYVTSLLPGDGKLTAEAAEKYEDNEPAEFDPIAARLRVESWARDVRFLTVLQASDKDKPETPPLVDAGSAYAATMAHDVVVVFPHDLGADVSDLSLAPPPGARTLMVTGAAPNGEYALVREGGKVHVTRGKGARADGGGVLWLPLR